MATLPTPAPAPAPAPNSGAQGAVDRINALRKKSMELLKNGGTAALDLVKGIWNLIMNFLRWLAQRFGLNTGSSAPKEKEVEEGGGGDSKTKGSNDPKSLVNSLAAGNVDKSANEAIDLIHQAGQLPADRAEAFMAALEASGITSPELLSMIDPQSISKLGAPDLVIDAALNNAIAALDSLNVQTVEAHAKLSSAATQIDPGLLTDDVVATCRKREALNLLQDGSVDDVDKLFEADDNLKAILGHSAIIRETMVMAAAHTQNAGTDLTPHASRLRSVIGHDWVEKISAAAQELAKPASVEGVSQGIVSENSGLAVLGDKIPASPAKNLSLTERFKAALDVFQGRSRAPEEANFHAPQPQS